MTHVIENAVALQFAPIHFTPGGLAAELVNAWGETPGILLGHATDGVIWGRVAEGRLSLARDHGRHGPGLDGERLRDLRLFDAERELRVWGGEGNLYACMVRETAGASYAAWVDRDYALIHRPHERLEDGEFVEMLGLGGQRHAPPGRPIPRGLRVRHYFEPEPNGLLREAEHRYLQLVAGTEAS